MHEIHVFELRIEMMCMILAVLLVLLKSIARKAEKFRPERGLEPHFKCMNFMYSNHLCGSISFIYGLMIGPHDDQFPVGLIA